MPKFVFDVNKNKAVVQSDYLDNLREHFSAEDISASIARYRTNNSYIPTRKYCITPTGLFDIGLFSEIYNYIKSLQIAVDMVVTQPFKDKFKPTLPINDYVKLNLELKEHQDFAVRKCLKQGRGIVLMGTGGGKTLVCATLIETLRKHFNNEGQIVIIVPTLQLIEQTYDEFIHYGINPNIISRFSAKYNFDPNAKIVITGTNILLSKKQDIGWLYDARAVLVDEVHMVKKSNKISKVIDKIKTDHKFGFTGTTPEDDIDKWNVIGKIGPILSSISSHELREEKLLSNAEIKILKLQHITFPNYSEKSKNDLTKQWDEENDFIYNNDWRNNVIKKLCGSLDKNSLILVDRITHGETLFNLLNSSLKDKKVYFIRGEVPVDDREIIRAKMEESDNVICIAISKIFSTGINIKNLPYIIFALAGKAKVKIIQSIGRGLRLHENKERLIIFDIVDNFIYSERHLQKRKLLYNKEKIPFVEIKIYGKKKT